MIASGECGAQGDNLTWTLDTDGMLTISGTGAMKHYEHSNAPWYNYTEQINAVTIGNGVTNIGNYTLRGCENLASVTIPNSVISIGDDAFSYCISLTSITIPAGVTSVSGTAFWGCSSLASYWVDSDNEVYSSDANGIVFNKDKTELLQCPCGFSGDCIIPAGTTSIGDYAFAGCSSLTSVTIPDSVTSIGYGAFTNCYNLTDVTIPNSVTCIGGSAFYGCWALGDVYYGGTAEDWEVISIGNGNDSLYNATKHTHVHQYEENMEQRREATCTENGQSVFVCAECGNTVIETIPIVEHEYTAAVTPPTCMEKGYTSYTCDHCGESYQTDYVAALDHSYVLIEAKPATCTEDGHTVGIRCERCEQELLPSEVIPAMGHSFVDAVTPPTMTERGYTTHTCSVCGYSYREYLTKEGAALVISEVEADVGETVTLSVNLYNNPGINTFRLGIDYNDEALTLVNVELGEELTGSFVYEEKAVWLSTRDTHFCGTILMLTFTVKDETVAGDYPVMVTYEPGDIGNLHEEQVNPTIEVGGITVRDYVHGDINGDGVANNMDLNRLMRYLAGVDVMVQSAALDCNGDGSVNNRDLNHLMKYLAGDDVELY